MVDVDERVPFDAGSLSLLSAFDFEGATLKTRVGIEELATEPAPQAPGLAFQVDLELQVDNKGAAGAVHSPYLIHIRAAAVVRVLPDAQGAESPRDLAIVNGASLLWSAMREQVSTLTARMTRGAALLPTVQFLDLRSTSATPDGPFVPGSPPCSRRRSTR